MPRVLLLSFLTLFLFACKEDAQETEAEFELNKGDIDYGFHLGGGLCVVKALDYYAEGGEPRWEIEILDCYDLLMDTVAPTENVMKYRQGGLCFYNDCIIEPENSFTMFMKVPKGFIDSKKYIIFNIFVSKYNDSTMLYKHVKWLDPLASEEFKELLWYRLGKVKEMPKIIPKEKEKDTLIFFKKDSKSWEELFSTAKPLEIKDEDFSEYCNGKFCSTKDFLNPLQQINCRYGVESNNFWCYSRRPQMNPNDGSGKYIPKCLNKLWELSEKYGIVLMHSGAFPAGDCDLGNWRYLKIDNLSKEHYEKLKDLVREDDKCLQK
jgi:hypothetical protein